MAKILEQLRGKPRAELEKEMTASRDKLWALSLDLAQGKVKNVREMKALKRTIARIKTILSESKAQSANRTA